MDLCTFLAGTCGVVEWRASALGCGVKVELRSMHTCNRFPRIPDNNCCCLSSASAAAIAAAAAAASKNLLIIQPLKVITFTEF